MRQILYTSFSTTGGPNAGIRRILQQARHNNALDGVTGLLWCDGTHFMQILEGPEESLHLTFERISCDPRHRDIHVISDCLVAERSFGDWTMIHRVAGEPADLYDNRLSRVLAGATVAIRAEFVALAPGLQ